MLHDPGFLVPLALTQAALFLVLLRALDVYEPEPLGLLAFMALTGATIAPVVVLLTRPRLADALDVNLLDAKHEAVFAAVVEEPSKGLSLLVVFLLSRVLVRRIGVLEFDGPDNGFVYGVAVGLGFAFTENVFYLSSQATLGRGFAVFSQRTDFLGTQGLSHAAYTAWVGMGLGLVTDERSRARRFLYPVAGLAVAIGLHAIHDLLATGSQRQLLALVDYVTLFGTLGVMLLFLQRQRDVIAVELDAERRGGLALSPADIELAVSWPRFVTTQLSAFRARRGDEVQHVRRLRSSLVQVAMTRARADTGDDDLRVLRSDASVLLEQQRRREAAAVEPSSRIHQEEVRRSP